MTENTTAAGGAVLDLRILIDWPETPVEPGQRVTSYLTATAVKDGVVAAGPLDIKASIKFIRDADGDLIHDLNEVVGQLVGGLNTILTLGGSKPR